MESSRCTKKVHYDKTAKPLDGLKLHENVRVQDQNTKLWKPACVVKQENERSYVVQSENGAHYRRNRRHLIKSNEKPHLSQLSTLDSFPDVFAKPCSELSSNNPPLSDTETSSYANAGSDHLKLADPPYVTRFGRVVKPKKVIDV